MLIRILASKIVSIGQRAEGRGQRAEGRGRRAERRKGRRVEGHRVERRKSRGQREVSGLQCGVSIGKSNS